LDHFEYMYNSLFVEIEGFAFNVESVSETEKKKKIHPQNCTVCKQIKHNIMQCQKLKLTYRDDPKENQHCMGNMLI